MKALRIILLIPSLLILSDIVAFATYQNEQRRPCRFLIPESYIGWIRIDFNVKDAPPLPIEDEHYLFKIPPSGHLQTSSEVEYGWARDDHYYYIGDTRQNLKLTLSGDGGMIWAGSTGSSTTSVYQHFFVGTEEQFKKCGSERDENFERKIGPLSEEILKKCMQK